MKRYALILCLVLIVSLSGVASAQIVLGPPPAAAGGVFKMAMSYGGSPIYSTSNVLTYPGVGGFDYATMGVTIYYAAHGAFEFYLAAATFPTTMTANNFTAKLDGLNVDTSFGTGAMNVDLFDMGDGTEDGAIKVGDFNSSQGNRIERRTHMFSQAGTADFNNIDVTCAVRNDLFGDAQTDFSGFILKPSLIGQTKILSYDPTTPTLTINPGVSGPKCGGDGGGDGGGGGGCFIATAAR